MPENLKGLRLCDRFWKLHLDPGYGSSGETETEDDHP